MESVQKRRSSISQIKILCFQIKENLLKSLDELFKLRQIIYSHFRMNQKEIEFSSLNEDVEFIFLMKRKMNSKELLTPQDNQFFEATVQKLLEFKLQFTEKNDVIVLFLQKSKNQINNNYSIHKKLIDNMDQIRMNLFQYYNSYLDE